MFKQIIIRCLILTNSKSGKYLIEDDVRDEKSWKLVKSRGHNERTNFVCYTLGTESFQKSAAIQRNWLAGCAHVAYYIRVRN